MTDEQFERIKNGLNFHSEGGVYNLCTLTETALREIIEDAVRFYEKQQKIDAEQIRALQKQNGELADELKLTNNECKDMREELKQRIRENQKLCEQIEKMKCCGNCRFSESDKLNGTFCHREGCFVVASGEKCKLWEN